MIDLKYIMIRNGHFNRPIFFMEPVTHIGMLEALLQHPEFKGFKLVSAGFCDIGSTVTCHGKSESLRLAGYVRHCSRPKRDKKIIELYFITHGYE